MIMVYSEDAKGIHQQMALPSIVAGLIFLKALAKQWQNSKPGREAKVDGLFLTCRYSDGKLANVAHIEPFAVDMAREKAAKSVSSK